ncbi:methyltransferase domain-containing protein [Sphingomonas parva]|uniref:Methyltransferase domain-containing protein n=1 Tax=Sphingomonas parva TaxID=2555898 RepID=A0A4Y8ZM53_9SPHN|nr:methyltransferase domain-containing protein [Sphingomonas parva]TFI56537.1 methyltransferase domain-containing protein [Sphingomonas parva]
MSEDTPFDRRVRRLRRNRAAPHIDQADYLHRLTAEELLERLDSVTRSFSRALILGAAGETLRDGLHRRGIETAFADPSFRFAREHAGVQCDEDRLPFADAGFDLVVSIGLLDSVNDLPGALLLIRRALRPDGLFLGAFAGAGSLPRLRSAMLAADEAQGGAAPRIHPQIDVRAAGDLLTRAGFALPVVDCHGVDVRFPHLLALVRDLRAMGATNVLAARSRRPLGRHALAAALADFAASAEADGKTAERFEIIHLLGWAPAPDQPKPARRGSATMSLAAALKGR